MKIITNFSKINKTVKQALYQKYPEGLDYEIKDLKDIRTGGSFKGLLFDLEDNSYIIKMDTHPKQMIDLDNEDYGTDIDTTDQLDLGEDDENDYED